ncbi:hypothetical protein SSX86_016012 [Deinandra increscens subsp. villosa]|uniref:Hexosyltransferase n=1 Tax=Deinandra increscens subsp. villosa TaxID=3103831 RepID=A0AAP0CX44_9ASTR
MTPHLSLTFHLHPHLFIPPSTHHQKCKTQNKLITTTMPPKLYLLLTALLLHTAAALRLPEFNEAPAFRNGNECNDTVIHIAMTLDATYLRGSIAGVFSIIQHSTCPENTVFHFLTTHRLSTALRRTITATFPYLTFHLHHFHTHLVKNKISTSIRRALDQPLNYARIYLADLLPDVVHRVIYLDSDVIVVDDVVKLWEIELNSHVLGAPEYCLANFTTYFTRNFWNNPEFSGVFTHGHGYSHGRGNPNNPEVSRVFTHGHGRENPNNPELGFSGRGRGKPCYFNTGVMVIDMVKWRALGITRRLEGWMGVQKRYRIYELGSLPPFLLVFAGDVEAVEHRWNQHGLGGDNVKGLCRDLHPGEVSLLHWSGKGKPWLRLDSKRACPLDGLWAPYDLLKHGSSISAGVFEGR